MFEEFGIEIKEKPTYNDDYLEKFPTFPLTRKGVPQLFVWNYDYLNPEEKKAIRFLISKGILAYSEENVTQWCKDYFEGRGIEAFLKNPMR